MKFAVIDIETTGSIYRLERIIEIAIFVTDGQQILDQFESLVNPETRISPDITRLTGITNEMVADAPKFYEIAKKVFQITENCIFVAHNANFDYWFVKTEFKRLGGNFNRKSLCTVKLSRQIIPKMNSYSLGKLCYQLGIPLKDRHRAAGDAHATTLLFHLLFQTDQNAILEKTNNNISGLHTNLDKSIFDNLPEEAGVYYFYDDKAQLIYVGKSVNIQQRVLSHFYSSKTKRAMDMKNLVADIGYQVTGSELVALLKESAEIHQNRPFFNRTQRKSGKNYGIFMSYNSEGYACFESRKMTESDYPLAVFEHQEEAKNYLFSIVERHQLCQKLAGLYKTKAACFQYTLQTCLGACVGKENAESYNKRALEAVQYYDLRGESFVIIDEGRSFEERSIIVIEKGKYLGFGFVENDQNLYSLADFKENIQFYEDNQNVRQILKSHLKKDKKLKIVRF